MAEEPQQTPSHHSSRYWKRHPERRPQASEELSVELGQSMDSSLSGMVLYDVPRMWLGPTNHAACWLWERMWDWPFLTAVVTTICVGLAYLLAQEHMYLYSRILVGIGAALVFLKVRH